jgi:hypothetical protein
VLKRGQWGQGKLRGFKQRGGNGFGDGGQVNSKTDGVRLFEVAVEFK